MQNKDRERAIVEVVSRIVNRSMEDSQLSTGTPLVQLLNDTIYQEKKRLKSRANSVTTKARNEDRQFWDKIQKALPHANDSKLKELLHDVSKRFVSEVVGNFNPKVYETSVKVLPVGLSLLLNALSPTRIIQNFPKVPSLENNILISGQAETLQRLAQKGTIMMVPTHLSNLDSPVIGWSIYKLGLPPFTYGAGLNLFSNPLLSFFMQNLGAYRVDRRKKAPIYKDILKEYAACCLEYGYHSLFFPGGTRSRSGMLERKLKKGLLGTAAVAYTNNLIRKKHNPKIFIVPCTLNYHLVLEAETLVEDYLKEAGKARYIIEDDEFSDIRRILQFVKGLGTLNSQIHVSLGQAFDPFGNRVDEDGESYDNRGRHIDISRYVMRDGVPTIDNQRDREYTNELSLKIAQEFSAQNMIMVTHLVAHVCFSMLERKNPSMDLYRLLHTGGDITHIMIMEVEQEIDRVMDQLIRLREAGEIRLEPWLAGRNGTQILDRALKFFKTYHTKNALERRGDRIVAGDMNLLYYYRNRLVGYVIDGHKVR